MFTALSPSSKKDPAVRPVRLAAVVLGGLYGVQCWRLASIGLGSAIPWYGSVWILLGYPLLGYSIAAASRLGPPWKRGLLLGAAFSLPSAIAAHVLGLPWIPFDFAFVIEGVLGGLLVGVVACSFSLGAPPVPERTPGGAANLHSNDNLCTQVGQRLIEGKSLLDRLDAERISRGDPRFGNSLEQRIVWNELIDLELQEIDEEIRRICHTEGHSGDLL